MSKFRTYFIGDILKSTDDVFDHARAIMLLRFCVMFFLIFLIPLVSDFVLGYEKAAIIHGVSLLVLFASPFIMKRQKNLDKSVNFIFIVSFFISLIVFFVLNPERVDAIGLCWTMFFLILSSLLQRGSARILFACFLLWVPFILVLINMQLNGALTINWLVQEGAEEPPVFLVFIPIVLSMYAVWTHTTTIQKAKETITAQKTIISEKNKDMLDSMNYAKRIQDSLLPSEKYIERVLKNLNK
jgi:hypothetical protein